MKKKIWVEIMPGYQNMILRRIRESEKNLNRGEQRAELLLRNEVFRREVEELQPEEALDGPVRRMTHIAFGLLKEGEECAEDRVSIYNRLFKFRRFCDRWKISRKWDGSLRTLANFIKTRPELIYHPIYGPGPSIDFGETAPLPDDNQDPLFLLVKIEPWTLPKDISSEWGRIEKLKKAIFGFSDKDKWNFEEALCWYDLKVKHRWSYGKIALLWQQEKAPHEHEDDIKTRIRLGVKRISSYIKRLTPFVELINVPQSK